MALRYDPPRSKCAGRNQPGAVALRRFCLAVFAFCEDAGIYVCRKVAGSSNDSVHGDGRAWDAHFDQPGKNRRNPAGDPLANWLVANADALGVQVVIWNRLIWSATRPYWRAYTGPNPHIDHVHVELNWPAAESLTVADLERVWAGTPAQPDVVPALTLEEDMPYTPGDNVNVTPVAPDGATAVFISGDGPAKFRWAIGLSTWNIPKGTNWLQGPQVLEPEGGGWVIALVLPANENGRKRLVSLSSDVPVCWAFA